MREPTTAKVLNELMGLLGSQAKGPGRIYFVGGTTAVGLGFRASTKDVDLKLDPKYSSPQIGDYIRAETDARRAPEERAAQECLSAFRAAQRRGRPSQRQDRPSGGHPFAGSCTKPAGVFEAIREAKEELRTNIKLAAPDQFIPPVPGWRERSLFVARFGQVDFYHYDLLSQALAKIERGHAQDLADVRAFARCGG